MPQLPVSNSNSSQGLNCSSLTDSLSHQPTRSTELTLTNNPVYNISAQITQKHRSSVPVQLLLSGPHRKYRFPVSPLVHVRNLLLSNGRCLQSHYLATGVHATCISITSICFRTETASTRPFCGSSTIAFRYWSFSTGWRHENNLMSQWPYGVAIPEADRDGRG
jgi:hypothetical protein